MADAKMFGRDEVLAGLPARRVSSVLYAIERRTATLAAQARQAMATYRTERSIEEQESAFLAALSSGRATRTRAPVQDLERYAPEWADLVPDDAASRAALARLVGQTYRLPKERVPKTIAALGLDDPDVAKAFSRVHGEDIGVIWAKRVSPSERLRWWSSSLSTRIESLPSFWMAFALTLTEAVGLGILVLPIALAGLGPVPGLFLLVVLGIANLVTVGALVESITRDGPMRYGSAYFGRLVADLLGRAASIGMGIGLIAFSLITLLAFYLAFGVTLSSATGTWAGAFVALIFGVNLVFLYRESIDATIASAILIGIVNIALIALLVILALPYVSSDNIGHAEIPLVDGNGFDMSILALVFGVILSAYFGHTSAANASKAVLRIEPGGRGLLLGNLAALLTVIALYCVTVFVFLGALGSESLVGFGGTVLTPLAELIGPVVDVVGSLYVSLAIGLGSIYYALGSYNQIKELLPRLIGDRGGGQSPSLWSSHWARRLLAMLPTILIFLLVEALIFLDSTSITDPLALVGTLVVPVIGGVFPMLLIFAARRRGELVPSKVVNFLGRSSVVVVLSALFIAAVFAHGLFIWEEPIARVLALVVGFALLLLVLRLVATRTFRPRTVIELQRRGYHGREQLESVVSRGRSMLTTQPGLTKDHVQVELPTHVEPEVVVWAHTVTAEGVSEPLAGKVHIELAEGGTVGGDLDRGRVTLWLGDVASSRQVEIAIVAASTDGTEET